MSLESPVGLLIMYDYIPPTNILLYLLLYAGLRTEIFSKLCLYPDSEIMPL